MKKEILIKRKKSLDAIEKTNSVEGLLKIGEDAGNVHNAIAVKAYRKAIAEAGTGADFAQIIEHLSYLNPDSEDSADPQEEPFDYGFMCDETALTGARKFKDQLKWQNSDNDEGMELWEKSDLKRIIDAIDEFLGDYLLIEKILNPGIKNEDYDWRESGKQG